MPQHERHHAPAAAAAATAALLSRQRTPTCKQPTQAGSCRCQARRLHKSPAQPCCLISAILGRCSRKHGCTPNLPQQHGLCMHSQNSVTWPVWMPPPSTLSKSLQKVTIFFALRCTPSSSLADTTAAQARSTGHSACVSRPYKHPSTPCSHGAIQSQDRVEQAHGRGCCSYRCT